MACVRCKSLEVLATDYAMQNMEMGKQIVELSKKANDYKNALITLNEHANDWEKNIIGSVLNKYDW